MPRGVKVIGGLRSWHRSRQLQAGHLGEALDLVLGRGAAPGLRPAVELRQQHPQRRRLDLVEARVVAHVVEGLLVRRPVEAQATGAVRHLVAPGDDRAAVAQAWQVLRGEERERGRVCERTRAAAAARSAGRLGRILEHRQSERRELLHRSHVAEQMHRDDRPGARRDRALDRPAGHARGPARREGPPAGPPPAAGRAAACGRRRPPSRPGPPPAPPAPANR